MIDFDCSQTKTNLARSFAGECQAGARYQFLAKECLAQNQQALNAQLKSLAKQEMAHAKIYYDFLQKHCKCGQCNINIEAGYPFPSCKLEPGFLDASIAELSEHKNIYPSFAKIARDEGYDDVAQAYEMISKVEGVHHEILSQIAADIKNSTLFKKPQPTDWQCTLCGHEEQSKSCWKTCPLCKADQGYAQVKKC